MYKDVHYVRTHTKHVYLDPVSLVRFESLRSNADQLYKSEFIKEL